MIVRQLPHVEVFPCDLIARLDVAGKDPVPETDILQPIVVRVVTPDHTDVEHVQVVVRERVHATVSLVVAVGHDHPGNVVLVLRLYPVRHSVEHQLERAPLRAFLYGLVGELGNKIDRPGDFIAIPPGYEQPDEAHGDDDFVELRNYTRGPIDVSGWSIHLVGDYSFVISLPEGTILNPDDFYTIGRTRRRAFPYLNQIDSDFRLPNTPFVLKVKDGAGTTSDTADFRGKNYLPGGMYLPFLRKSAIRRIEFFGPEPGDLDYNWMTYNVSTQANISSAYDSSVLASPGSSISGEGFSEDY